MKWAVAVVLVVLSLAGCLGNPEQGAPAPGSSDGPGVSPNDVGSSLIVKDTRRVTAEGWASEPSVVVSAGGAAIVTAADAIYSPIEGDAPGYGGLDISPLQPGLPSRLWVQEGDDFREVPQVAGADVTNLPTGNEGHVAASPEGDLYFVDMTRASTSLVRSQDGGQTWEIVNPAVFQTPVGDRPWVAAGPGGLVAVTWNQGPNNATQQQVVAVSTDYGVTFPTQTTLDSTWSFVGTIAIDHGGSVYVAKEQPNGLALFTSQDAGATFQESMIHETDQRVGYTFVSVAADGVGGLHVAWAEARTDNVGIWYTQSADQGRSWSSPVRVTEVNSTNAMPWISAIESRVAIGYYTSPNASGPPENTAGDWYPGVSTWNRTDIGAWLTWTGSTPVHRGTVCTTGSTCDSVNRRLADCLGIAVARDGTIHVAWTEETLRFRASKVQYAALEISEEPVEGLPETEEVQERALQALVVGDSSAGAHHGATGWGQLHPPIGAENASIEFTAPGPATMKVCAGPCQGDGTVLATGEYDDTGTLAIELEGERFLWWLVQLGEAAPDGRTSVSATYTMG